MSLNFFIQDFFGLSLMKLLISVEYSKKYSSGLSSPLTRQDSEGEILQDSNGVLVVVGVVAVVVNGVL